MSLRRPFIIDLESTNGTHVNDEAIPVSRYYELKPTDGMYLIVISLHSTLKTLSHQIWPVHSRIRFPERRGTMISVFHSVSQFYPLYGVEFKVGSLRLSSWASAKPSSGYLSSTLSRKNLPRTRH